MHGWQRLEEIATRLSTISREHRYDPYKVFDWPDTLPPDQFWISPELMTCFETDLWSELSDSQRVQLSHYEAINFFSLNVHLIRDLIGDVAERIYTTRYPGLSEFFHDFIAEENTHAWFFATFCRRYGDRIYPSKRIALGGAPEADVLRDITVFGRILVAEELCDFFNARMADDERLPPICRQINRVHHDDESRHIAFGRQMMRALREEAAEREGESRLADTGSFLARYVSICLRSFYNRDMYLDAGLPAASIRSRLLASPGRRAKHRLFLGRTVTFLQQLGMVDSAAIQW